MIKMNGAMVKFITYPRLAVASVSRYFMIFSGVQPSQLELENADIWVESGAVCEVNCIDMGKFHVWLASRASELLMHTHYSGDSGQIEYTNDSVIRFPFGIRDILCTVEADGEASWFMLAVSRTQVDSPTDFLSAVSIFGSIGNLEGDIILPVTTIRTDGLYKINDLELAFG